MTQNPTLKQVVLLVLTALTVSLVSWALLGSWQKLQIQSQLELYQVNLVLQATQWQPDTADANLVALRRSLLGDEVFEDALQQYQRVDRAIEAQLTEAKSRQDGAIDLSQAEALKTTIAQLEAQHDSVDLNIGILQAHQQQTEAALQTWQKTLDRPERAALTANTARSLIALWEDKSPSPPRTGVGEGSPDLETLIGQQLQGWFRDRVLVQLYQVQSDSEKLTALQASQQARAATTVFKLALLNGLSIGGLLIGFGLLIFLIWQRIAQSKTAILTLDSSHAWSVPWDWEITCQAIILGFFITFFVGQTIAITLLVPNLFQLFALDTLLPSNRLQALSLLLSYAIAAAGGLFVLYLSVVPFRPLPKDWFQWELRPKTLLWGVGGYFAAVPLVIGVSLLNQQLWQGQGGSNPILEIALQKQDWWAIACFVATASIAAPIFEELMFRGFLLPTLTAYLPTWGAIIASSLVFAFAHLSLSEVLPLATLGIVLGVVYTRSRNLLASMFLHGLWNASTLLSLFILGSSAT
jgi:membrane protease YdiL (CAAX protease family)